MNSIEHEEYQIDKERECVVYKKNFKGCRMYDWLTAYDSKSNYYAVSVSESQSRQYYNIAGGFSGNVETACIFPSRSVAEDVKAAIGIRLQAQMENSTLFQREMDKIEIITIVQDEEK